MQWTPVDIKVALLRSGISGAEIARKLGVTRSNISAVINGRRSSYRVRQAIAEVIGRPVKEIWPDAVPPGQINNPYHPDCPVSILETRKNPRSQDANRASVGGTSDPNGSGVSRQGDPPYPQVKSQEA